MNFSSLFSRALIGVFVSTALAACQSSPEPAAKSTYRSAKTRPSLEVPPDLLNTSSIPQEGGEGSQLLGATGGAVLPAVGGIDMKRKGQLRWLEIDAPAEEVWPRLEVFVQSEGLSLVQSNPQSGVMETDWMEGDEKIESSARQAWRKIFGNMVGTANNYDKFRIRIERIEGDRTELYVIHRALEKVAVQGPTPKHVIDTTWQEGSSNPELEYAMLSAIKNGLGRGAGDADGEPTETEVTSRGESELFVENPPKLRVPDTIDTVWRETGVALAHAGIEVERSDVGGGFYEVLTKPDKRKGFFSKMFKRKKGGARYRVDLEEQLGATEILIRNSDGTYADKEEAIELLERLKAELDLN